MRAAQHEQEPGTVPAPAPHLDLRVSAKQAGAEGSRWRESPAGACVSTGAPGTCVVDLWAPGIQAMRLGVAAPHPHSLSTPQEASWAPEAWDLRGQGQRQAAGQRLCGAGRGH